MIQTSKSDQANLSLLDPTVPTPSQAAQAVAQAQPSLSPPLGMLVSQADPASTSSLSPRCEAAPRSGPSLVPFAQSCGHTSQAPYRSK